MAKTNLFRHSTKTVEFKAGETIFAENDLGETMFVVVSGTVDIFLQGQHLIKLGEGEIFGEMALIEQDHQRTGTAVAETDVVLANVNRERFMFLVHESPFFALDVMRTLSERLRLANKLLADAHHP